MIRVRGSAFFTRRLSSSPSINGILISVTRISGCAFNISGYAYSPSPASPANSNPWLAQSILSRIPCRMIASSSTRNTFTMVFPPGLHFSLSFLSICPNTPVFHFRPHAILSAENIHALLLLTHFIQITPPVFQRRNLLPYLIQII